jgi:hypothetical protein
MLVKSNALASKLFVPANKSVNLNSGAHGLGGLTRWHKRAKLTDRSNLANLAEYSIPMPEMAISLLSQI